MILPFAAVVFGIAILVLSADHFVSSASRIARFMSLSSTFVGLTIVSFGTSAPEILVSINSVVSQSPSLAVGNAIGSNIANIGLVLGLTVFIFPLVIERRLVQKESVALMLITALVCILCIDRVLSFVDGMVMLAVLFGTLLLAASSSGYAASEVDCGEQSRLDCAPNQSSQLTKIWLVFIASLACLLISAKALVWGAISMALFFNVSEHIIGLTVVALGTSLPELAATIASARRRESGLAIGNIIGSNLFNFLAVLCIPALFGQHQLDAVVIYRDLPIMAALTFLVGICLLFRMTPVMPFKQVKLGRPLGLVFLTVFSVHYLLLYASAGT